MNIENEVEKLKAISDDAANTRDIARKAYDVAMDPSIGDYSTCGTPGAAKIAYKTAAKAASAARDDYIAEKEKEENKMSTENKMKELRVAAYDAELALSKATAAAWHAASDYCGCAGNVSNASEKDADENSNEVTHHTREIDWDSYLKAMDVLSAAKNIAQKTKVIPTVEYK